MCHLILGKFVLVNLIIQHSHLSMSVVVMACQEHTTQWHWSSGMFPDGHPDGMGESDSIC